MMFLLKWEKMSFPLKAEDDVFIKEVENNVLLNFVSFFDI